MILLKFFFFRSLLLSRSIRCCFSYGILLLVHFVFTLSWCHVEFSILSFFFVSVCSLCDFIIWRNENCKGENVGQTYLVPWIRCKPNKKISRDWMLCQHQKYNGAVEQNSFIQLLIKWDWTSIHWMRLMKRHLREVWRAFIILFRLQMRCIVCVYVCVCVRRSNSLFATFSHKDCSNDVGWYAVQGQQNGNRRYIQWLNASSHWLSFHILLKMKHSLNHMQIVFHLQYENLKFLHAEQRENNSLILILFQRPKIRNFTIFKY